MRRKAFFGLLLFLCLAPMPALAQCAGVATDPQAAADCAAHGLPPQTQSAIDPHHAYTLAELVDIAEHNNPATRIAWERAKQTADALGVRRSAYFPILAAVATFAGERTISPFPKPLAPLGYTTVEAALIQPEVTLQYLIFDSGARKARLDAATAETLVAGARFIQTNQDVAFRVTTAYYKLLTAQERLQAAEETLKTAQTTQDAAEARLKNGRATLPDVLNARAETAQAVFDRESADGDQKIARVELAESIGVEPSPDLTIDRQPDVPLPQLLNLSVDQLMDRAFADRPDLQAQMSEIRAAGDAVRAAKAEYGPRFSAGGDFAQTSLWPRSSGGVLGSATKLTFSAAFELEWKLFDGGARKNELAAAESKQREAQHELTEIRDRATREVWSAYIAFTTAVRKEQAAEALLESANASYSASLDAYNYGVKNLIDVVTAEKQLAQARLSGVSSRSQLLLEAVHVEFVTGNLLRGRPLATNPPVANPQDKSKP
jgi:outer membrane protein TolC